MHIIKSCDFIITGCGAGHRMNDLLVLIFTFNNSFYRTVKFIRATSFRQYLVYKNSFAQGCFYFRAKDPKEYSACKCSEAPLLLPNMADHYIMPKSETNFKGVWKWGKVLYTVDTLKLRRTLTHNARFERGKGKRKISKNVCDLFNDPNNFRSSFSLAVTAITQTRLLQLQLIRLFEGKNASAVESTLSHSVTSKCKSLSEYAVTHDLLQVDKTLWNMNQWVHHRI